MIGPAAPPFKDDLLTTTRLDERAGRLRWLAWWLCAASLLGGQLVWLFLLRDAGGWMASMRLAWGNALLGAVVLAVAILLATTPADARRLRPAVSALCVIGGTALLSIASVVANFSEVEIMPRAVAVASWIGAIAVIVHLLQRQNTSAWWAVLAGWNPWAIYSLAHAHGFDAVTALLLALMLLAARREAYNIAACLLACATALAPLTILLLPYLWRDAHERDRRVRPAGRSGRKMFFALFVSLGFVWTVRLLRWAHTSAWTGLLDLSFVPAAWSAPAMLVGLVAVTIALGACWQSRASLAAAGHWVILVVLLASPVQGQAHLGLALLFVPLLKGSTGWAALAWSMVAGLAIVPSPACRLGAVAIVGVALAFELTQVLKAPPLRAARQLSVPRLPQAGYR